MSYKWNIDDHKRLWNWLAENPDKNKWDWPGWDNTNFEDGVEEEDYKKYHDQTFKGDLIKANCFACESSIGIVETFDEDSDDYIEIFICPLQIRCNKLIRQCLNGLYIKWDDTKDLTQRSAIALQIANLPEVAEFTNYKK